MVALLWAVVLLPLAAAAATRLAGPRADVVALAGAAVAAIPAWILLVAAAGGERATWAMTWLPAAPGLDVGLRLDALSVVMAVTVASVGLAVVAYAGGYFANEPRRPAALAGLLAFLCAMQGLVLADGYLTLLIFWEIVGALSARLIAFDRAEPDGPAGAVRAFLTTRAADVGLYVALLALYAGAGTLAFGSERPGGELGALVGIGLVLAAMGKSAQAPLQGWLAGAMAGPTPVSALLHSATMVAAGVYLLVRSHELLAGWPLEIAGWVGAITAVAGAVIALAQQDLKRVLAASTTSQLGLMFVGAAAGGPAVAIFHLVAHAAGKATLFLAAGMFQHDREGTALERLRGAGRDDRAAMAIFAVGALSIAAVPPFAAFWSKDAITAAAEGHAGWLALVLLAGAGGAAYLLRVARILWAPAPHTRPVVAGHRMMAGAAGTLAAASVGLGLAGAPLAALLSAQPPAITVTSVVLSLIAAAVGAGAILLGWRAPAPVAAAARAGLYADAMLRTVVQAPVALGARLAARWDDRMLDGAIVDGTGRVTLRIAHAQRRLEERRIDAAVDELARAVGRAGAQNRRLQTGRLHEYLRDTVLGTMAVVVLIALAAVL